MRNLLILFVSLFSLFSCTSDDLLNNQVELQSKNVISIGNVSILQERNILSFNSMDEFRETVKKLGESRDLILGNYNQIITENENLKIVGFHSILDDYIAALSEADNYYDSEEHYKEFKDKYSNLYFPEYGDDYSVYLPVSDKNVAKLLNSNGEIEIAGTILNMKDITSYEQLVELGETMSENDIMLTTDEYLNGTPELTNGGDRRLKVRVYTQPGSSGVYEEIVVDVSFRKKGAFGAWYNYKSETTLGWVSGSFWSKSGFSSHDYKFARVFSNGSPVPFRGEMYVDFQGFRGEIVYFRVDI